MKDSIVVVGLNEINFDYIKAYIERGELPFFKRLLAKNKLIETVSEDKHQLLEPWIQWVSIQTGKTYEEHKVFRLGDITERKDLGQIFEEVEKKGRTVGAISPFNADNRLQNPAFFIPDPWTETSTAGSWVLKGLSKAVSQAVNNNAKSKVSAKSVLSILFSLLLHVPASRMIKQYPRLLLNRNKAGAKAIILDSLLSDTFIKLLERKESNFSWLLLNSGAHIQHHYLFNSEVYQGVLKNPAWYCEEGHDPLLTILQEYDGTLSRIDGLGAKLIVLTGLHQKPHECVTFYWRLNEHRAFMKRIGIDNFTKLLPRMSRDFLIEFDTEDDTKKAERILGFLRSTNDGVNIFTVDNRGKSIFVEMTYPNDIDDAFSIVSDSIGTVKAFKTYISFVAIKNGEHTGIGYVTSNFDLQLADSIALVKMYDKILDIA
ncbi:hypothetical protein [Neolewinella antarctica]|uniref:Uncharacterized protein n=1 Tax=Neolewinella antarctica TaxID=442734 RepID=A0ABX0XGL1_9BACT|nr:hypothetical protein [Neolewinella antarctica]NJC28004.1 hypothetical protein [Neolewinella antarctica]